MGNTPPLRVLVVDDCPDATASLAYLLRAWGHDVRTAHSGPEALTAAAAYRPDVVLLDLQMPGMDGHEVTRRLRRDAGTRDAFVVVLSGYCQEEDRRRSLEAGCDLHWAKPVEPEALQRLLASRDEARRRRATEPGGDRPSPPECPAAPAADAAEARLSGNPYLALKRVRCEWRDGVLTLRGCLPSYYLKQVAQTAVAAVEGVTRVRNEIEVVPAPRSPR